MKSLSHIWFFVTPSTVAFQDPLSMGFSRQEYWSGLPFPSPEDLPDPRIEPRSPALQADSLPSQSSDSLYHSMKTVKSVGRNLTKYLKDFTLKVTEHLKKERCIPGSWIWKHKRVVNSLQQIYTINLILIKIQAIFL